MMPMLMVAISPNNKLEKKCLQVGTGIANQLDLNNDQFISLYVGLESISLTVSIKNDPFSTQKCCLHPQLISAMGLGEAREYGIRRDGNSIHIGPLIGIMANQYADPKRPFGNQSLFISQLITQARNMGAICYAFKSQNVNIAQGNVEGYTYINNTWKIGTYRLPNVIYPRENISSIRQTELRKKLSKSGCLFINPPWLGKWQSYKILSQIDALRKYIPDTYLFNSFKQVAVMLRKYQVAYMKPVAGSQGDRIIRVSKARNSRYRYQYQMNHKTVHGNANSLAELERSLKKVMAKKAYIVQQPINLLRNQGSLIDMRVMTQKNADGQWEVSGKAFRIGRAGSITSNISGGGRGCQVKQLLSQHFPDPQEAERIIREVDCLAIDIASALEKSYMPIGELGIDIGVDQDGQLWFIEANLKPARKVFTLIGEPETRLLTVQRPIQYARYLAGFRK